MATQPNEEQYKEKYRPSDEALDKEINEALGDMRIEDLYDEPRRATAKPAEPSGSRNQRRGKVISISKDDIFVDFGSKSQGILPRIQFADTAEPVVGDEIEVTVDRYEPREGLLILSRKGAVASHASWDTLQAGQVVEGTVSGVVKGGLEVDVKGMRAFMPAGQIDIYHVPDISVMLNERVTAEVIQFDREHKNLVISRRNVLEQQREAAKQQLMTELAEGQTRRGTVRTVMDYGAFVDLGGVDGLLHVSEMSFRRVRHPSEIVKVGDIVEVKVTKIDKESGKLSLSLKQAMPDPWTNASERYATGSQVTGRVSKVEAFGAFVEVEEGVEGLLPVSEISYQRINRPSDVVKVGDTLKLVVLSVDERQRRMSFSLKQAGPDPWSTVGDRYATDMVVGGKVTRVVDFGAFVELEPGLEGLVHISELSPQRVRTPNDVVKVGQDVKVRVLDIDKESRRIALSIKGAQEVAPVAEAAPAATPEQPQKKKKRPELRGGLDFDFKKNK